MGAAKTEAPGFTTDGGRSRGFAGFGIRCDDHLCLDFDAEGRQDKLPYSSEEAALARLRLIEQYQRCIHDHTVVRVYHLYPGRRPAEADGD